ncbi:MAG: hypothetical protein JWP53_814 [Conexibacter sp.]|nr:hypothetical protein [Conexibacter sp.]
MRASPWASSRPRREPPGRAFAPHAWLLAALLAALYLVLDPPSADLAAQTYRTWLFEHAGPTIWDNGWYAGHHVPAYSILFPPLAALLGPRLVGALAAVAAAWAFERLALLARGEQGRPAALWFATATAVSLVTGRLTFALGLAAGLLAILALARGRMALCAVAGAATALASPVAAAFLALALVAWGVTHRRLRLTALLCAATLAPALALTVLFPEGGDFPFTASAFWPSLAATLLVLLLLPREQRTLRLGVALYAVLVVVSGALSTPMGGNAVRLGAVFAGPLAAIALWPDRRRALLLLLLPLAYWQVSSPIDDVVQASRDRSVQASYYDGMLRFLATRPGDPFRVEIPFTDNHWESARVAPTVPLARGWERQLDRKVNGLFYDGQPLTAARYRGWLDENAVRYVALADAPIDYSAAAEAALVRSRPPYLREVYRDAHWRIFAVAAAAPMARGAGARVVAMDSDTVDLDVPRAGRILVRVRFTPYWRIVRGHGCVAPAGDWTQLTVTAPGRVRLATDFALSRVRATGPRCTR